MKLSIIVPVYNVEQYIVKCINTLLQQNTDDYEIVIVNDGTKDKSIELIEQNFNSQKLKIITQTNQGLSVARNTGMQYAQGEYVWFFDSDDWITPNSLQQIIKELIDCDILYFESFLEESKNGTTQYTLPNRGTKGYLFTQRPYFHCAPFMILHKEFLLKNNLSFEPGILHEDSLFTPCALYLAKQIKSYPTPVYHRLLREGSITHIINPKRCTDLMIVIEKLIEFASHYVMPSHKDKWGNCIAEATNEIMFLGLKSQDKNLQQAIDSFLQEHRIIRRYLSHAHKIPTRIMGHITLFFNIPLYPLYKILYKIRYKKTK